jgi:hypothetical protein
MMLRRFALVPIATAFVAPAMAEPRPATPPASQSAKPAPDPNQIVCERQAVIGSRLATERVCHTRAQWADLRIQDRQAIEHVQIQRGMDH